MPRPKSELTKSGKTVGIRVTQSEYEEWVKLGKGKWLRSFLKDSRFERKANGNDTRRQGQEARQGNP